jgi:hypothetical protein
MGRACSTKGGEEVCMQDIGGWIILKYILEK